MMPDARTTNTLAAVWQQASKALGINVIAPFGFTIEGRCHFCVALLPDFSGPNGIVLVGISPPDFDTDSAFVTDAKHVSLCWSFLNTDGHLDYNESVMKEALSDWGYLGNTQGAHIGWVMGIQSTPFPPVRQKNLWWEEGHA